MITKNKKPAQRPANKISVLENIEQNEGIVNMKRISDIRQMQSLFIKVIDVERSLFESDVFELLIDTNLSFERVRDFLFVFGYEVTDIYQVRALERKGEKNYTSAVIRVYNGER